MLSRESGRQVLVVKAGYLILLVKMDVNPAEIGSSAHLVHSGKVDMIICPFVPVIP